jgi:hypothetical protein
MRKKIGYDLLEMDGYTLTIKEKEGIKDMETRSIMTKEQFENNTNWKMTFEEYLKCNCTHCDNKDCIHREAFRRVPVIDGGLGLCPNLKES